MAEKFYLWEDVETPHSPYWNMAADELLLESAAPHLEYPLLRLYRWDRPSLSIGRSQTYPADQEARYCIVRRPTGGGNVFHDVDLTYTVVVPAHHPIAKLNRMESYRIFHQAMLPMVSRLGFAGELQQKEQEKVDRATMKCFVSPSRFDVVERGGGKFAGAAQRRTRAGILHQGSVKLDLTGGDWDALARELLGAFRDGLDLEFVAWRPENDFPEAVSALAGEKYSGKEWNREFGL